MVLLARREPDRPTEATIAQLPSPKHPIPADLVQQDWGIAIGICSLVLVNLWQILKAQLSSDDALQKELIKAVMEQNKVLLQAVLDRKTG
jgi:hypothetical protein